MQSRTMPLQQTDAYRQREPEIDVGALRSRLLNFLPLILGLSLVGVVVGATIAWTRVDSATQEVAVRVTLAFPGIERGEYPDGSKFQPTDLIAPDLLREKAGTGEDVAKAADLARGLTVAPIIPANVVHDRERLRALGQEPPPYTATEYEIILSMPAGSRLGLAQRRLALNNLVAKFQAQLLRFGSEIPSEAAVPFSEFATKDFYEYESALRQRIRSLHDFLTSLQERARGYRSPHTGLSFGDLAGMFEGFEQTDLTGLLSYIDFDAPTADKTSALRKLGYQLQAAEAEEDRLSHEKEAVEALLSRAQARSQSYVLTAKAQSETAQPVLSENMLAALVANDSYNFLIRRALDAALRVEAARARQTALQALRQRLQDFQEPEAAQVARVRADLGQRLTTLEASYRRLLDSLQTTHRDYASQQFADAVRITAQPAESSAGKIIGYSAVGGWVLGALLGVGLAFTSIGRIGRSELPA